MRWFLLAFTLFTLAGWNVGEAIETPATNASDYILRPGDRIAITLMDNPPFSTPEGGLEIPADGKIAFWGVEFQATGRTREQVRQDIIDQLKKWIKNPSVSVNLAFTPYNVVSINGAVNKPGELAYRSGMTLLDALANAGGLSGKADRFALIFTKDPDGTTKTLNANVQALLKGDLKQNYSLKPGDIIQVNDAVVYMGGSVNKPGELNFRDGMTLLDALASAGGLNGRADKIALIFKKSAEPSTQPLMANVQKLLKGDLSQNFLIDAGDVIQVNDAVIYLDGHIRSPGSLSYLTADTAAKAIASSGGVSVDADLRHAFIRRGDEHLDIDLSAIAGDDAKPEAPTIDLQPGDLLYIPGLKEKISLIGDVKSAGFVYLIPKERDKLLDAFSTAGGPNASADLTKIYLRRIKSDNQQIEMTLNLGPNGSMSDNVILQDGDIVYVPQIKEKNKTESLFTASLITQLVGALRNL